VPFTDGCRTAISDTASTYGSSCKAAKHARPLSSHDGKGGREIEDNAGRLAEAVPAVRAGSLLEHHDRLGADPALGKLGRVVENLAEAEAYLLGLIGAGKRLHFRDIQAAPAAPAEVELRPTAGWEVRRDADGGKCRGEVPHGPFVGDRRSVEGFEVNGQAASAPHRRQGPGLPVEGLGQD
jgi:hypothetical protein